MEDDAMKKRKDEPKKPAPHPLEDKADEFRDGPSLEDLGYIENPHGGPPIMLRTEADFEYCRKHGIKVPDDWKPLPDEGEESKGGQKSMAYGVWLKGYSEESALTRWEKKPAWWDERVLRSELKFVEDSQSPGYQDWFATVTPTVARQYADRFRPKAYPHMQADVVELDWMLADPVCTRVLINIFEWESGCGD